jgi:membrane-associated phospholipid phosphatase
VSTEPLFTRRDLLYAAGFTAATVAMFPLDKRIAGNLQREGTQANRFLREVATSFRLSAQPGALIIGGSLYAVGRVGRFERVADLGLHGTEAILFATVVGNVVKGTVGRARPYAVADTNAHDFEFWRGYRRGSDYSSFPSGHTLTGFAAASAVTAETNRWWPHSTWFIAPIMYGGATMIGLSRLYNDKHWASDVVMAAGIGTLSGIKIVRFNHSHPRNRLDRWLLSASVRPAAGGGLAFAWSSP